MKYAALTGALSAAILAGATLAVANEEGGYGGHKGPRASFEELDRDQDGQVTKAEMQAHREAHFTQMDTDGDGLVSEVELLTGMQKRADSRVARRVSHMMERHDANDDGKLSVEEMQAQHGGRMFERADSDGDGAISREEFDAMKQHWANRKNKG